MPLLLSRDELRALLDLDKAIRIDRGGAQATVNGQIVPHAPYHIPVGANKGLRVVSGRRSTRAGGGAARSQQRLGGGDKMYALAVRRCHGRVLSFMAFRSERCEPRPWSPSLPSIWRGKIQTAGSIRCRRTLLEFSTDCFPSVPSRTILFEPRPPRRKKILRGRVALLGVYRARGG